MGPNLPNDATEPIDPFFFAIPYLYLAASIAFLSVSPYYALLFKSLVLLLKT